MMPRIFHEFCTSNRRCININQPIGRFGDLSSLGGSPSHEGTAEEANLLVPKYFRSLKSRLPRTYGSLLFSFWFLKYLSAKPTSASPTSSLTDL